MVNCKIVNSDISTKDNVETVRRKQPVNRVRYCFSGSTTLSSPSMDYASTFMHLPKMFRF